MSKSLRMTQHEIGQFIYDNLGDVAWVAYVAHGDWEDEFQSPQDGLQHIYWEKGEWHAEWMSWPVFSLISGVLHVGVYINYGPGDQAELDSWDVVETTADLELGYTYEQQERDATGYIEWVIENGDDPLEYFSVGWEERKEVANFAIRITLDVATQEAWVERVDGQPIPLALGKSVLLRPVGKRWSAINGEDGLKIDYAFIAAMDKDGDGVVEYDFGDTTYSEPKTKREYKKQLIAAAKETLERMRRETKHD